MIKDKEYAEFLTHLPACASDKALIVLKAHLLIERALRMFIESNVHHKGKITEKVQFSSLVCFASALSKNSDLAWIWQASSNLNSLRNRLAHSLTPANIENMERTFIEHVNHHDGEASVFMGLEEVSYNEFSLAAFQLYDSILSAIDTVNSDESASTPTANMSDEDISRILLKAFRAVEEKDNP